MTSDLLNLARRTYDIEPFHVMELLAKARQLEAQGRDIVHMEIGEPDFPTADPIIRAGIEALQAGQTHYTPAVGLLALRQAISDYYHQHDGVNIAPERILITPGSSGALHLLMSALINPGDHVLLTDPGYPCNRHFVRLVEGEAVSVPVTAESGYQMTLAQLQNHWTPNVKAVLLASPANPTGTLIPQAELRAMADFVHKQGAHLLVDEIYHGLIYGAEAPTALTINDDIFIINSFSKYFGMTGWRIGWLVAPTQYVPTLDKIAQNIFLAAPTPAQYAALAAFNTETLAILEQRRQEFQRRRDYLLPALQALGFEIKVVPQGAFYLYADCSRLTNDSYDFCLRLLNDAGVAITPGIDFGHHAPKQHVRFAYTTSLERLEEGVKRLREFLEKL